MSRNAIVYGNMNITRLTVLPIGSVLTVACSPRPGNLLCLWKTNTERGALEGISLFRGRVPAERGVHGGRLLLRVMQLLKTMLRLTGWRSGVENKTTATLACSIQ